MSEEISKVSIFLFKNKHCDPCRKVEPILRKIIDSSKGFATLTIIDTDNDVELAKRLGVKDLPVVYYNDQLILTGNQAVSLLDNTQTENTFDFINLNQNLDDVNEIFGKGQSGLFNHLFNELINTSIESNAELLERRQKLNMITLSQKYMTPEAMQNLSRPSVGDYVHIGVLQSVVTSILAINPRSSEFLYRVGREMGKFGNMQYRLTISYPQIFDRINEIEQFRYVLEGLQELYNRYSLGLPLFIAKGSLVQFINNRKAKLTVYDSAYCSQISPIGQPICYLIAGEISGLIEGIIGELVSVEEVKCFGLGDANCEFSIELGLERDFSFLNENVFLREFERQKFQQCLSTISENMYYSSLIKKILRTGFSDHVHISVLQQAMNGIKFSDPFFSTLLFYAGFHYGKFGADFAIIERLLNKDNTTQNLNMSFEDSLKILTAYFNDPATILTRWQGKVILELKNEDFAYLKIYESAISSGLNMRNPDFVSESDIDSPLCDFTTGFIQGRLTRLTLENLNVSEIACVGLGSKFCQFKIEIK